ncbi:P-loop containing nucleoside triphosphate hydrolase protein [Absidia repens]|uniref:p-loop containing nucleoside triphosphate hydrolase protein n=1 Tax=Absidia repens TaxID=90262 RepID=A0A1X2I4Z3_9FUNG|nr:P-loop containing nucleoside triphosphate hydrolase protein [Absidia repens]
MTTFKHRFLHQLEEYKINLDGDTVDYLGSMLADLSINPDIDEVRGSTEAFLEDADVGTATIDSFYKQLGDQGTPATTKTVADANTIDAAKPLKNNAELNSSTVTSQSPEKQQQQKDTSTRKGRRQRQNNKNEDSLEPEPTIIATSQQSRFHLETLETLSKEIDLKTVNITVSQVELLVDAHLRLKENVRYGLVGPNGTGKSVLMKCLGDDILTGLPQNLQILHVVQLETGEKDMTILDEVLSSDRDTMLALEEYDTVNKVIGNNKVAPKDTDMNAMVYQIMVNRSKETLRKVNAIATKRSGARGWDARNELVATEAAHAELLEKDPQQYITPAMANDMVTDVMAKAMLTDYEVLKSKAAKILRGLGFSAAQLQSNVSTFSGGWRMRIALAKALFMEPNILLLDEPTNHLDLPAILWLQEYLIEHTDDMTVVIVSHNREFLNNVTEETIILKDKKLKYHNGDFQDYERNTEEQRIRKQALLDKQETRKKKIMSSIQQDLKRAKTSGDDKRLGQVVSRTKKLDRLGMEKTEDGKRFKQSYRAGYHFDMRESIVVEQKTKTHDIYIPDPPPLRTSGSFLTLDNVSFKYTKDGPLVVKNVSLSLEATSRITLLGVNGSGKSTLLDLITGKLQPTSGMIQRNPLLRVGYFTQNVVDSLNMEMTPVELLKERYPSLASEQACRAQLGSVGIGAIGTRPIKYLSGGQRSRVVLAMILYDQPHVLILDEITNHLDMGTIDLLVESLSGFAGCLVLVSHDFWFLKQLMEPQPSDNDSDDDVDDIAALERQSKTETYSLRDGIFKRWEKGLDAYVASTLKSVKKQMVQ